MNPNSPPAKRRFFGCLCTCLIVAFIGGVLAFIFILPLLLQAEAVTIASKGCLHAVSIVRSLDDYATDHQGNYPAGKSSTEIFQILLDGHYLNDPDILYLPMSGKVKAETYRLKPENVCWDVTYCNTSTPPEGTPFVFSTGYKISYIAGSQALPQSEPSLLQRWGWNTEYIAICDKEDRATSLRASPDGTIPNFIPAVFDPKGKTYHQLTPDGKLPP